MEYILLLLLSFILLASTYAGWSRSGMCKSLSRFIREPHLDNRKVVVESDVMTPVSLKDCAQACYVTATCLSFLYNQDGGRCQLMARIYVDIIGNDIEHGNTIYRKHLDGAVCDIPKLTDKGRVLYVDGLAEGSQVVVICDEDSENVTTGVCDVTGTWIGLGMACVSTDALFTDVDVDINLVPGACLSIVAIPTSNVRFKINLKASLHEIQLQINARFSDQTILRNSKLNDTWGDHETYTPHWPFQAYREFTMDVCTTDTQWIVSVDDIEVCTYNYRGVLSNVAKLSTSNDIAVKRLIYTVNDTDTILL